MRTFRPHTGSFRLSAALAEFAARESASGLTLLYCTVVALLWANSPWSSTYHALWHTEIGGVIPGGHAGQDVLHLINDGLMTVFFFLVGLEIKRELVTGELASFRTASLPVVAALGGMIVPAAIYAALNHGGPGSAGWGIPMATDIAFSLGVLALAGSGVPAGLRVFLTAFAIVDDLGAVLVIALFYSAGLSAGPLMFAAGILALMIVLNLSGVRQGWVYLVLAVFLWFAVASSGIHATIAGVLASFAIPLRPSTDTAPSLLVRMESRLHPWVAFAIMPLFALANAGVTLTGNIADSFVHPVTLGVIFGLCLGKLAGLLSSSWLAVFTGLAVLPQRTSWRQMTGVATLGGIGFTMSLFIAGLAFGNSALLAEAKVGILAGSILSGWLGFWFLRGKDVASSDNGGNGKDED